MTNRRQRLRRALACALHASLAGLGIAVSGGGAAVAQEVGRAYSVTGTNPDGSAYAGTAEIIQRGSTCRIAWRTGPTTSEGVCIASGKSLAAFYRLGNNFGLVLYEAQSDGSLRGYWTIVNREGVGGEILMPKR